MQHLEVLRVSDYFRCHVGKALSDVIVKVVHLDDPKLLELSGLPNHFVHNRISNRRPQSFPAVKGD